jgi:hypothetical protein
VDVRVIEESMDEFLAGVTGGTDNGDVLHGQSVR